MVLSEVEIIEVRVSKKVLDNIREKYGITKEELKKDLEDFVRYMGRTEIARIRPVGS